MKQPRATILCPACVTRRFSGEVGPGSSYSRFASTYICSSCGVRESAEGFFWINHCTAVFQPHMLFNCCAKMRAPDWAQFKSIEVGGCIDDPDDKGHTIGGIGDDKAEFWTVYARHHNGEAEAITDCVTRLIADTVAAKLGAMSRLPVTD